MNSIDFYCKDKKKSAVLDKNYPFKMDKNIVMHRGKQQKSSVVLSKSPQLLCNRLKVSFATDFKEH